MATTPKLNFNLLELNQASKHVTVNEALYNLDVLTQTTIIDKDLSTPPGSPSEGDCYIVGSSATGDWLGQEDSVAAYQNSSWEFYSPNEGWMVYVLDEDSVYYYRDSSWLVFYKEGTFTPVLRFGGSNTGITYDSQAGSYVQIGEMVFAAFTIRLSSKGSATGDVSVTGLPFTPEGTDEVGSIYPLSGFSGLTGSLYCRNTSSNDFQITESTSTGSSNLDDTNFTNSTHFKASVTYRIT